MIGVERGFVLEAPDGGLTALGDLWDDPGVRMNEGGCDPEGRFHCGSMAYDHRPGAGSLYRLDPGGSVEVVMAEVTISNGLDWSPDGTRLAASGKNGVVMVFDAASGTFGVRLELPNPDFKLPGGQRCKVTFPLSPGGPVATALPPGTK